MSGLARRLLTLHAVGLLGLLASGARPSVEALDEQVWAEPDDAYMLLQMHKQRVGPSPSGAAAGAGAAGAPVVLASGADAASAEELRRKESVPELLRDSIDQVRSPSLLVSVLLLVLAVFLAPAGLLCGCRHCCEAREHRHVSCVQIAARSMLGLAIIAAVATGLALIVWYFTGALLLRAIERYDMAFLGVQVHLRSLAVNPYLGTVNATGLVIGNPGGYHSDHMAKVESLYVDLDMGTLVRTLGGKIVIAQMLVAGVDVVYETSVSTSNIEDLLDRLTPSSGGGGAEKGGGGGGVFLHEVAISDIHAKVALTLLDGVGLPVTVADIAYEDFDEQVGSHTVDAIIAIILKTVLNGVLWAVRR